MTFERTRGQQLVYEAQNWVPGSVLGVGETFPLVRNWPVDEGEPISRSEVSAGANVAVLGQTVAERIFAPDDDVVGPVDGGWTMH